MLPSTVTEIRKDFKTGLTNRCYTKNSMTPFRAVVLLVRRVGKWFKRHWKLSLFIVAVLSVGIFWWINQQRSKQVTLLFEKPRIQTLTQSLEVSGIVDAKEKALMRFAAGGKIVYLGAQEGDTVTKGQTIATIDQRDLRKRLQQDLNIYMQERWDWEQTLDDTKDRWIPKSEERDKDKEQWDLENRVLDVEIRDIAIRNAVLSAPFAGILVDSPITTTGVTVLATDVFELVNPSSLIFKAAVDEADIGKIKVGQPATIVLDAFPDQPLETHVQQLAYKSSQGSSGTVFMVELPIYGENVLDRYRLGMNGDAEIVLDTRNGVLTVPYAATREREDSIYVDVRIGKQTYEERVIEIGLATDEYVEVLSGLSEDDEILIPQQK